MAWTAPRTWVASEVVTASIMNSAVRDNFRYLKGLDGNITIEANILTAFNVDGVDVSSHESRHVSGGADDIDSALAIAAMPNLTQDKVWKGNVSNRPIEVDFALTEDIVDAQMATDTQTTGPLNLFYRKDYTVAGESDSDLVSSTQTFATTSLAIASVYVNNAGVEASTFKLRLYMDGVQVAETAYLSTSVGYSLIASRALSGAGKICKVAAHNYNVASKDIFILCDSASPFSTIAFIGVGSVKL